jgi:two-component system sensor histidine kinase/response regulator
MTNIDKGTLLIVDDFPANLSILFSYLRGFGFHVNIAESGEDALEEILYSKPDIILLDVMMPGIDGYETCRRLKANQETCDIPVIFMTALSDTADKLKGFKMGAVDYITKPVQQEELLARVTTHLTLSRLQKTLEKQRLELQQQNNELEAFAHTVAHDLKNPFSSIFSLCDILQENFTSMPNKENLEIIDSIQELSHKSINIIDSLLLLASARNQEVKMEPISTMGNIINQARERLAPMIKEYRGEILTSTTWPTTALGYPPWIEEVWMNYISNGLKYGGKSPRLELGTTAEKGYFRFWIRDNGQGLTEEEQSHLFIPFSRIGQVGIEGHGLGLSIVQRIIEKCGGQVGVESQVGQGSTFYFTLPFIANEELDNEELDFEDWE